MLKKSTPIVSALGIAVIIGAPAVTAQTAERSKAIKSFASAIKQRTIGQFTIGKGSVEEDTVIVPLFASTTESVDEKKAIAVIDGIASGFCRPQFSELMSKYQFAIRFDLSVNGAFKGRKSFSAEQCSAIERAKRAKDIEKFSTDNGFGSPGLVTAIPGRENLPTFSFREWQGGVNLSPTVLDGCKTKSSITSMVIQCESDLFDLSGAKAGSIAQIYNGRLFALRIISSSDEAGTILEAFKAKYGKPCKSDVEIWQNRAGGKFDNPVYTWCFRTGDLKFSSIGSQTDYVEVNYTDINGPKPEKPTVNF